MQLFWGLQSIAANPRTRPHGTELPQNQSWGIVNPTDVMGTAEKDGQEQGQSRVTGTRGTNTAPSATAVRGTAGPKPLPLLPKLSLFSQRGWLGTLSETCRGGEGIGGTPGGRGGAEKRAEPHRGAASHLQKIARRGSDAPMEAEQGSRAGCRCRGGDEKTSQARNKNKKKGWATPQSSPQSFQPSPGASGAGPRIPPCVPAPIPKTQ